MNFREDYDWSAVSNPITDEEVREWVATLRSGDYDQTTGRLHRTVSDDYRPCGYCCLGVANEALKLGLDGHLAELFYFQYEKVIPIKIPFELQKYLYGLNDRERKPFNAIADVIEKGFNLV